MLVLSRRQGEAIRFPGIDATVRVVTLKRGVVRLGIEAPPAVTVLREELPAAVRPTGAQPPGPEGTAPAAERDHFLQAASRSLGLALLRLQAGRAGDAEALLQELHRASLRLRQQRLRDARKAGPSPPVRPRKGSAARKGPAAVHE